MMGFALSSLDMLDCSAGAELYKRSKWREQTEWKHVEEKYQNGWGRLPKSARLRRHTCSTKTVDRHPLHHGLSPTVRRKFK